MSGRILGPDGQLPAKATLPDVTFRMTIEYNPHHGRLRLDAPLDAPDWCLAMLERARVAVIGDMTSKYAQVRAFKPTAGLFPSGDTQLETRTPPKAEGGEPPTGETDAHQPTPGPQG